MNEKLTAYVLHELPPDERAEFEALIHSDPALREQVEEMRSFCDMLSHEISQDEPASLTLQQRASVIRAFASDTPEKQKAPQPSAKPFWRRPAFLVPTALAACVAFALVWNEKQFQYTSTDFLPADATPANRELSEEVRVTPATQKRKVLSPTAAKPPVASSESKLVASVGTIVTAPIAPAPPLPPPALPPSMPSVTDLGSRKMELATNARNAAELSAKQFADNANQIVMGQIERSKLPAQPPAAVTLKDDYDLAAGNGGTNSYFKLQGFSDTAPGLPGYSASGVIEVTPDSLPASSPRPDRAGMRYFQATPPSQVPTLAQSAILKQDMLSEGGAIVGFDLAETPGLLGTWASAQNATYASLRSLLLLDVGSFATTDSVTLDLGSRHALSWTSHDPSANSFSNFDTGIGNDGPFDALGRGGMYSNNLTRLRDGSAFDVGRFGGPLVIKGQPQPDLAQVERQLEKAYSYYNLGDYDNAYMAFNGVIRLDPNNAAARRGMERVEQKKSQSFDTARDHTRARMLAEVAKGWQDAIPASISVSTGPIAPLSISPPKGGTGERSIRLEGSGLNQFSGGILIAGDGKFATGAKDASASPPPPLVADAGALRYTDSNAVIAGRAVGDAPLTGQRETAGAITGNNTYTGGTVAGVGAQVTLPPTQPGISGRVDSATPSAPISSSRQLFRGTELGSTPPAEGEPDSAAALRGRPMTLIGGGALTIVPGADGTLAAAPAKDTPLSLGKEIQIGVAGGRFGTATVTPAPATPVSPTNTPTSPATDNQFVNGLSFTVNQGKGTTVNAGTLFAVGQDASTVLQDNTAVTFGGAGGVADKGDTLNGNVTFAGVPLQGADTALRRTGEGTVVLRGGASQTRAREPIGGTLDTNGLIASAGGNATVVISAGSLVTTAAPLEVAERIVTTHPQPPVPPVTITGATINGVPIVPTAPVPGSPESRRIAELTEQKRRHEKHLEDLERESLERSRRDASGESYTRIYENPFLFVRQQPLSTFSIDVDTASYANVRRFLNDGQLPPPDAVRLEELINYFPYAYEGPSDGKPFGVMVDVAEAPWQPLHRIVRVALKGREIQQDRGGANFVFLVDVSGSMGSSDKLPLVQQSLLMLTDKLRADDRVAIVVYAGNTGLALPSTKGSDKATIRATIESLHSGGSTNGAGGITLAYDVAAQNFIKGGVNRVILCTDGDFNVGISSPEALEKLIAEKAKSRIFLSVLGFGTGNLKDRTMETLADKGNGNYAYIDSLSEARKVLVEQMEGTLVTIAKDVKIQVEFNPAQVAAYRLLGYENRLMAKEDFNNDKKDAGEIGAGHTVTALYEIVPASIKYPDGRPLVDDLKYAAKPPAPASPPVEAAAIVPDAEARTANHELLTVKLRYKQPEGDKSDLLEVPVADKSQKLADAPKDFQFAASVAGFGMLLRGSQHSGELTWDMVRDMALRGKGEDALGYRGEFLQLLDKARGLSEQRR